jgi:TPR repeat protein
MYYAGQGMPRDYTKSAEWFSAAAGQGYANSQYYLGWMYYKGQGVLQDYTSAAKWYTAAAERGHADAQNKLGRLYYRGWGVPQDYQEALNWYTRAAGQGNVVAQRRIGWLHSKGLGVPQDYGKAIEWYTKAAAQDDGDAHNNLACVFAACPDDRFRDGEKAIMHATKACELAEWKKASRLDTLASAYAEVGQFEEAVKYQKMALQDPDFLESSGEEARARLAMYEAGTPYRLPAPAAQE